MEESNQSHWIPLSDLMTGMMLVFMLIAIVYMVRIQQAATDLRDIKGEIYRALDKEFSKDLKKWDAEITPQLTVRFRNPDTLYQVGKDKMSATGREIIDDFIPRYLRIVTDKAFSSSIKEIVIASHTSPEFKVCDDTDVEKLPVDDETKTYMCNMTLSVNRAWWALEEFLRINQNTPFRPFVLKNIHLLSLASSDPIMKDDGVSIDEGKSRRVEFKIITNADDRLEEIAVRLSKR